AVAFRESDRDVRLVYIDPTWALADMDGPIVRNATGQRTGNGEILAMPATPVEIAAALVNRPGWLSLQTGGGHSNARPPFPTDMSAGQIADWERQRVPAYAAYLDALIPSHRAVVEMATEERRIAQVRRVAGAIAGWRSGTPRRADLPTLNA